MPSNGGNPTSRKKEQSRIQSRNRERIIEAALEVFSRYGYRGSTVAQIADAADMSKANLLYYFSKKEEIYRSLLESTLTDWLHPLTLLDPDGDPAEQIWAYAESKLAMAEQNPKASRLFANEILQGAPMIREFLQSELRILVDEKTTVIQHWIDQGKLTDIKPLHLIFIIWATTQHYADFGAQTELLTDEPENLFSDAAHTLKKVLLKGIVRDHS